MPLTPLDGTAYVITGTGSLPLPLGENWLPGDLRLAVLSTSTNRTITPPPGWVVLFDSAGAEAGQPVSRRLVVIARELQGGDADTAATTQTGNVAGALVTLRGADNAAVLASTPSVTGSNANSAAVTAPGVPTGDGMLVTGHMVTRLDQTANQGAWTEPPEMVTLAAALSDGPMGYNVLLAGEQRTGGASGTRTAQAASAGAWSALALFVPAAEDEPGPGPGGDGAPAVLNVEDDIRASGGVGTLSVEVPAVAEGHGLLAVVTSIYNGDDMTPGGGEAWTPVGGQLGDSGGEANQRVAMFVATPTGTTGARTVTATLTNESSLTVLHLDAPPVVEDVSDHLVPRNAGPGPEQTIGPVDVPAEGGLVLGVWAGVQFTGGIVWTPDDPGVTVRGQGNMGGDGFTGYLITTEVVETGPVSRSATASGVPVPTSGFAGKLVVISAGERPQEPEPAVEPGRLFLAYA
ncbi:hypothetical protein [Pseudonocardia sp. NPDC049635]|uniref:hypothetical protein n=1 Tax=Pseudonocardia sp. NPDC049635 TaxID=3155506 RepID=UPI0033EE52F0